MTVAKLLKKTPKEENSFCFECNNTEDLPYIQNGGVIAALLRVRTKHVVPLPAACRKLKVLSILIFRNAYFMNSNFPGLLMSGYRRQDMTVQFQRSASAHVGEQEARRI